MSVMLLLIVLGVIVAGSFLGAFIWAMRNGQYEDTYSPSVRILFDIGICRYLRKHSSFTAMHLIKCLQ
jgi:cbb3-type cytochrome oxidase maturation protein